MLRLRRIPCILASLAEIGILVASSQAQNCIPWNPCSSNGLIYTVTTDSPSYIAGDPITYSVIATNPTSTSVTLDFTSSQQADYLVDSFSPDDIGLTVLTQRVVPANGFASWQFVHPWNKYWLDSGQHRVVGHVVQYGTSEPVYFDILAPPPVTHDVFIDFEHFPDGTPTHSGTTITQPLWENAFIRDGISFHSQGGSVNFKVGNSGAALYTPTASYPPGSNIIAEFDMPVYTVSADVGTAAGYSITMYAYDAGGQPLGSATAPPSSSITILNPLSFDSAVPIASVQWFSSIQNAAVRVDNLFLNVDLAEMRGDFNNDGISDAADYIYFRKRMGQQVFAGLDADANHDGIINNADLVYWRQHYGWKLTDITASAAIPEPSTRFLAACAGIAASVFRRLPGRSEQVGQKLRKLVSWINKVS
jgi:hypothetical protein